MNRRLWLLTLLVLSTACSAGGDDGVADTSEDVPAAAEERYEAELFPTTKVLNEDNIDALLAQDEDGSLRLRGDAPIATNLAVDDVILATITAKTPHGLLVQVTGLQEDGDALVAQTIPAPIPLAFKHLDLRVIGEVSFDDQERVPPGSDDIETRRQPLGTGPLSVDFYAFNGDGDTSTEEDQVRIQGTFEGSVGFDFEMSIDWPDLTTWPPDVAPDVEIHFAATVGAEAGLAISGMASKAFLREETLATIPLPPFSVGLVTFFPEISLEISVEGGAAGAYALDMGASGAVTTGATASTDGGVSPDPPALSFDVHPTTVTSSWYARAAASAGPVLHLRLYDVLGPYIGLKVRASLEADQNTTPCWELTGELLGVMGFDMEIAGLEVLDWSQDFGIGEEPMATGGCLQSPLLDGATDIIPPTFTPWSRLYEDGGSTFSAEGSWTGVSPTVDGAYLVSGDGAQGLLKIDRDGEVLWARRYLVEDAVLPVPLDITLAEDRLDTGILATGSAPPVLLKLDAQGEPLWAKAPSLPFPSAKGFSAMVQTGGGDTILAQATTIDDQGDTDVWITRVDAAGAPRWSRRWGATSRRETPTALVLWEDDLVVVGHSFAVSQEPADQAFVLRLTGAGDPVWEREIRGCDLFSDLSLRTALISRDGDLIAGGRYQFSAPKAILLKLKADGSLPWAGGAAGEFLGIDLNDMLQLTDGGFLATGTWWTANQDDLWLARTDSVGRFLWLQRYDSGVRDGTPGLALTGEGGVLVTGYSDPDTEALDLWALRVPVEDGALSVTQGSPLEVSAADWTDVVDPCLVNEASPLASPADWPVDWAPIKITASPWIPEVVELN